jgi:hypothetical protein
LLSSPSHVVNAAKRQNNTAGSVISFPTNGMGAHSTLLVFKKYVYQSVGRDLNRVFGSTRTPLNNAQISGAALHLPLPKEINDSFRVNIGSYGQGVFGDAISQSTSYMFNGGNRPNMDNIIENIGAPSAQSVAQLGVAGLGTVLGYLTSRSAVVGTLAGGAASRIDVSSLAASVEAGAGIAVNPKLALQFKGMELKTHNFSWTMAPTNPQESEAINAISQTIKRHALPSYASLGPIKRAFLSYPSTVDIYFFGIEQSYFMYFKTCMIDNFTFNYSPGGMAILKGGKPAMVNMSLSLKEMDIHTAEDYGGGEGRSISEDFTNPSNSIGDALGIPSGTTQFGPQ